MPDRHIVALGGFDGEDETAVLWKYVLGLTGREHPRVCYVPTASGDDADSTVRFYQRFAAQADATHIVFFPWPPPDLRELVLAQDLILVGGGSTANMLAIWRAHGFDAVLGEAWGRGIALAGWSAGMICWFEAGVTDSFGPELGPLRDGLGFLPGSACPHYDGEDRRRPVYTSLVAGGFPPGYAADDGVGLHFTGTELGEVVSARPGARAYRVEPDGETPLEPTLVS